MIIFYVLFVAFLKHFPVIWKYSTFPKIFEHCEKRFSYRVARHFQNANIDHVMGMSSVRIEFTNDSFNIILCEFNVWQVLIGNKLSWWRENTVIFNKWASFYKKRVKEIGFFTEICNKFVVMNNMRNARNFFVI